MMPRRLTPPEEKTGNSDHVLEHGGLRRAFRVHLPGRLPLRAAVVIQLHGGGGNGVGLDRLTRFHELADRERFAVVSPNGYGHYWNDGRVAESTVDDVGFIATLIDHLAQWLPVDRRRVYVAGISNGAMLAARLAADIPDRIAAFAQVAGTVAADAPQWWQPDRPVPFLQIHGTADPLVPYGGGPVVVRRRRGPDPGAVLGVDAWAQLIAAHNRAVGPEIDGPVRRWRGASPQADVEFWRVDGGGHTWPGGFQYLPERIVGPTSHAFDATAAIWRFLSAHML